MHAADRPEFTPPQQPGLARAFALALAAHLLLLLALTWGVAWKRQADTAAIEAELWSSIPQPAAPRARELPAPLPARAATPPPARPADARVQADIALAQEQARKARTEQEAQRQRELQVRREEEARRKEQLAKASPPKPVQKASEPPRPNVQQEEARRLQQQREENLRRVQGMAIASGAENSTGTAQQAAGPSASYRQKLAGIFKRNLFFPNSQTIAGNPTATVQVRVSPSGLIMSHRLVKSSGIPAWDEAVIRAVDKTERIPADENGRIVPEFPVEFGPKDLQP